MDGVRGTAGTGGRFDTPARLVMWLALSTALTGALTLITLLSPGAATALDRDSAAAAARNSTSARAIYGGLADTDVAAAALFLAPDETRRASLIGAYVTTVDRVQRELSDAQVHAYADPDRLSRLTLIADELRVYRRVVDDGTTAGYGDDFAVQAVLASAYAREASHYMSEVVLPAVSHLSADDRDRLARARLDGRLWLAAAIATPVLVLAVLVAVQFWLWRRTRRRLNAGLLTASASVVAVLGLLIASWSHWPAADTGIGRVEARMDTQAATQERLGSLLSGRSDVYLALGASVDPEEHERDFLSRGLCGTRADQLDCAALAGVWTARQSGDARVYGDAVAKVLSGGSAAMAFDAAARSLTDRLTLGERAVDAAVTALPAAPGQHRGLTSLLALVAALAAVAGLTVRLNEYR